MSQSPGLQPLPEPTPRSYSRPLGSIEDSADPLDPDLVLLHRVYGAERVADNPQLRAAMLQKLSEDPSFRSEMEMRAGGLT